jgi:hypothetical protein
VRWRRIDLKRVIAERFGVEFHPHYVGKLLQKPGFSHISARPRQAAQDERIVEAFKKTSRTRCRLISMTDCRRRRRSKSGLRTRPVSARRTALSGNGPDAGRGWQYLRQNWLSNTVFENYNAIIHAACAAWRKLIAQPETITSIGMREWADVGQPL